MYYIITTYSEEGDVWKDSLWHDLCIFIPGNFEAGHLIGEMLRSVGDYLEHGTIVTHVGTVDDNGGVCKSTYYIAVSTLVFSL